MGLDLFTLGLHDMDERELTFALARYKRMHREARRRLRQTKARNFLCGGLAFVVFWTLALGPALAFLPLVSIWVMRWIIGPLDTLWIILFGRLLYTHPSVRGLWERWIKEESYWAFEADTHRETVRAIVRHLRGRRDSST